MYIFDSRGTKIDNFLKPNFHKKTQFENGPHVKSAFPAHQWTCSKGQGSLELLEKKI